jgi:integrase
LIDSHLEAMEDQSLNALMVTSGSGGFIRHDVLWNAMRRGCLKADLDPKGLNPHSLRRASATEYYNLGANVAEVQALLGDASPDAALRYIQPTNRNHTLINKMGEGFSLS